MSISSLHEPTTFSQAHGIPECDRAMSEELQALEQNHTWTIVPLSPSFHAIGCKWVYKIKLKEDGTIERYKTRLGLRDILNGKGWISLILLLL